MKNILFFIYDDENRKYCAWCRIRTHPSCHSDSLLEKYVQTPTVAMASSSWLQLAWAVTYCVSFEFKYLQTESDIMTLFITKTKEIIIVTLMSNREREGRVGEETKVYFPAQARWSAFAHRPLFGCLWCVESCRVSDIGHCLFDLALLCCCFTP